MKSRLQICRRFAAHAAPLLVLTGLACWQPLHGWAQNMPEQSPGKQNPPKEESDKAAKTEKSDKAEPQTDKKTGPPPANPLILNKSGETNPLLPSDAKSPSQAFSNYTERNAGPKKMEEKPLPLFGYDFFSSAREIIDAHRDFLKQKALEEKYDTPASRGSGTLRNGNDGGSVSRPRSQSGQRDNQDVTDGNAPSRRRGGTADGDQSSNNNRSSTRRRPITSDSNSDDEIVDEDGNVYIRRNSRQNRSDNANTPIDAYGTVGDPLDLLYRNINASVPANYQLSAGDNLTLRISSPTMDAVTLNQIVDAQGTIQIEGIGQIVVRGKTIDSAEKALQQQLRSIYKNCVVTITPGRLRTIQVLVTGAAYSPGTYNVPAVATAYNLLTIAGGPTEEGSLRDIAVRRQGKVIATLDIYKLLTGDAQISDVPLQSGDLIVIPPRRSRITVKGEVLHPAIFELTANETLHDALAYSGGVKASGLNQSVRINTVDPGSERILKDVNLKDPTVDKTKLFDGDEIEVFSVRTRLANRVTIEGAVDQPNDYALTNGMRVSDLVNRARGPLSEAFLQKAELHRWLPDNTDSLTIIDLEKALEHDPKHDLPLQKWDRIKVYTREEVAWTGYRRVTVKGAVKKPGIYSVSKNMHVSHLLQMAGGPTPDAFLEKAFLMHNHDDGPPTLEYVNISAALRGDAGKDPEIQDNDTFAVYQTNQAQFTPDHLVAIRGEVVNPGDYPRFMGMKVSDLIGLAGGFKPSAGTNLVLAHPRRVLDSPNTKQIVSITLDERRQCDPKDDATLEDGDVISVQGVGGYQPDVQVIHVQGAVNKPGDIFLNSSNMRLSEALKEAGGLRKEAYPQGAEFYRDPKMMSTVTQQMLVQNLSELNNQINDSETRRELAKAKLDLIKATGAAVQDSSPLSALGGSGATPVPNPAVGTITGADSNQLVSPPRILRKDQLDPNGFIAINLPEAMKKPGGADDIILVDGDTITVPKTPTTCIVIGAVINPRGVLYEPGRPLDFYVNNTGGFAPDAARDRIIVFHLGGGVIPASKVKELQPGDVVFVPTKVLAAKISSRSNPLGDFFKSALNGALIFRLFGL